MTSLLLVLMMQGATTQFLVSTRAGLVNYVQGSANVKAAISVPAGEVIATGPGAAVELLLNPGSYLRMGENTRVVLDRVELDDIAVRILQGSMVIETNGFNKDLPLKVTTGDLKMDIIK
ncbi:MAG TPA: FecR domain-containing protein, partial [Terriglobia bacterium]|nr:FecR domain-containing protein [Terriglobia bacterium]